MGDWPGQILWGRLAIEIFCFLSILPWGKRLTKNHTDFKPEADFMSKVKYRSTSLGMLGIV